MNTKINVNDFDYDEFDLEEFLEAPLPGPSFDDVRELMKALLCTLYDCNELEQHLENDEGIKIAKYEKRDNVEEDLTRVAHLVLNNAMFLISNGAEYEFTYQLDTKDKRNYRFRLGELQGLDKVIYGGTEGTIDLVYENGEEFPDDYFDCQVMEMIASFMYDVVALNKEEK